MKNDKEKSTLLLYKEIIEFGSENSVNGKTE